MHHFYRSYPYFLSAPIYSSFIMYGYPFSYYSNVPQYNWDYSRQANKQFIPYTNEENYTSRTYTSQSVQDTGLFELKDYGPEPFVININEAADKNNTFRTALWTGTHLQVTLMSLKVGEDIGLEIHPDVDQFIRIEEGQGLVRMGNNKNNLDFQRNVNDDFAIMIPAGTWHNVINTGNSPLKLYSIYAPPQHPRGTVHETKEAAEKGEGMLMG